MSIFADRKEMESLVRYSKLFKNENINSFLSEKLRKIEIQISKDLKYTLNAVEKIYNIYIPLQTNNDFNNIQLRGNCIKIIENVQKSIIKLLYRYMYICMPEEMAEYIKNSKIIIYFDKNNYTPIIFTMGPARTRNPLLPKTKSNIQTLINEEDLLMLILNNIMDDALDEKERIDD